MDTDRGSRILVGPSGYCLAVWVGSRVTPMVSQSEITVMRGVRDLSFEPKEENVHNFWSNVHCERIKIEYVHEPLIRT